MSDQRRHDVATAVTGTALVAGGAAARGHALSLAYGKDGAGKPMPRPKGIPKKFFHERKLLHTPHGRGYYLAGTAAGLAGAGAALTGGNNLFNGGKRDTSQRKSFFSEGVSGVNDALHQRVDTAKNPAPASLVAGNYGVGLGTAAGSAGLAHYGLKRVRIHPNWKSAAAATAGVAAGVATLPIQSKLTQRASHGKYETTPTGVRRRLVPTKSSGKNVSKYYGQDMTSGQKRARVMGASGVPIIPFAGDIAAATQAARMAPPELKKKTAALQFGGAQAGGLAGGAAAAYGATALSRHAGVAARAKRVSAKVNQTAASHPNLVNTAASPKRNLDTKIASTRGKLGLKPKSTQNPLERVVAHAKTPKLVRGALKPLMHNPKVAVAAGMAGSTLGGQAGGFAGYGHALKLERERNIKSRDNRHGVSKRDITMTAADTHRQAKKKRLQAHLSEVTGGLGITALGALGASKVPGVRGTRAAKHLTGYVTPALTASAGIGGAGSFNFARYTRKEADAQDRSVGKAFGMPRVPRIRTGGLVHTRRATGITTTATRRGGLVR